MTAERYDRLLSLLNVHVRSFGVCAVASGTGLRLPPNGDIKVVYILEGRGALIGEDGAREPFGPATILFIPPKLNVGLLEGKCAERLLPWEDAAVANGEMVIASTDTTVEPAIRAVCVMASAQSLSIRLFHNLHEAFSENLSDDPVATAAFKSMLKELRHPGFGTKTLIESLMMQCYVLALRKQIERGERESLPMNGWRDPNLGEVLLRMMDKPEHDHDVESLARDCGMSRTVFSERFSRAFGQPPMHMLKEIRMSRAAGLLKTTNMSIDSIAMSVGYCSRSYFSRAFKKSFDLDPKTFRERTQAQVRVFVPE